MKLSKYEDLTIDDLQFICDCLKRYKATTVALCRSKITSLFVSKKQIDEFYIDILKIDTLISKISSFLGK